MTIEQLQKAPFYLDYQDITWVRRTPGCDDNG